jgi:nitrate reductase gamma subunit
MPAWLVIAKGPIARFAITLLCLGILRLVLLMLWETVIAVRNAGNRQVPYRQIFSATLSWLIPITRLHRTRGLYSFASFGFHIGILSAGLFLSNHIDILSTLTGLSWSALSKPLLDVLTLVSIMGGLILLFYRLYVAGSRALSKSTDYLLLVLILNIFISGYVAGKAWNPIPYNQLMLFHVVNGIILVAAVPYTKIAHCVLFPLIRLGSEVAWHLQPGAGQRVVNTIHGPEGRKI